MLSYRFDGGSQVSVTKGFFPSQILFLKASGIVQKKQLWQDESSCFLSPFLFSCLQNNLNFHCNSPWHFPYLFSFLISSPHEKIWVQNTKSTLWSAHLVNITDRLSPYISLGFEDFFYHKCKNMFFLNHNVFKKNLCK